MLVSCALLLSFKSKFRNTPRIRGSFDCETKMSSTTVSNFFTWIMLFDSGPLDSYRWMNHLWALDIFTILFYFSNLIRVFFLLIRLNLCLTNVPLALPEHSITHSKWKFRKSKQKNWTVRKKRPKIGIRSSRDDCRLSNCAFHRVCPNFNWRNKN